MVIQMRDVTLRELIDAAKKSGIRRVLLTDYASTEMKPEGDALVLVGMTEVVATALDRGGKVIYRWSEAGESKQMVAFIGGAARGRRVGRKDQLFQVLREEGFEVDEGEWTPESAEAFFASRRAIVG